MVEPLRLPADWLNQRSEEFLSRNHLLASGNQLPYHRFKSKHVDIVIGLTLIETKLSVAGYHSLILQQ